MQVTPFLRLRRRAWLVVAFACAALAVVVGLNQRRALRPPSPRTIARPTILDDDALMLYGDARTAEATAREVRSLGVDWLRVNAAWSNIAPASQSARRPPFDARDPAAYPAGVWAPLDRAVRAAAQNGLRVLIDIGFWAPRWAVARPVAPVERQRWDISPSEYARFAEAVARRYSGRYGGLPAAVGFTIWNEPNNGDFLLPQWRRDRGRWAVDSARSYRELMYAAYPAIKRVAPRSLVLVGATFQAGTENPGSVASPVSPLRFLRELACVSKDLRPLRDGACRGFRPLPGDGWSHHPYSPAGSPDHADPDPDHVDIAGLGRLTGLLDQLHAEGRTVNPMGVYVTEFGYETNPPDPTARVDPAAQARFLPEAERLATSNPDVRSFAQFLLRDGPVRPGRTPGQRWSDVQSGLMYADATAKPALTSFRYAFVVHRSGEGAIAWWGHVRPGAGPRTVRITVGASNGSWRPLPGPGRPFQTDSHGYLAGATHADPTAAYRLEVRVDGMWRGGAPVRAP
ncbi:MAG: hypothetical protein QOK04_552 [Solirubrobacteraceae bacterium]|jgi:hypothetical protein|nr:hypothetical protein [Solirubrobacteraceae bacterium]